MPNHINQRVLENAKEVIYLEDERWAVFYRNMTIDNLVYLLKLNSNLKREVSNFIENLRSSNHKIKVWDYSTLSPLWKEIFKHWKPLYKTQEIFDETSISRQKIIEILNNAKRFRRDLFDTLDVEEDTRSPDQKKLDRKRRQNSRKVRDWVKNNRNKKKK